MFPEMRSVLVGGQSVKFHSQVAYFCLRFSLSLWKWLMGFHFSPEVLMVITLGFFFLSRFSYSFLRGAITEAATSNFA